MNREERRQFVREHRTCVFGYNRQEHGPAMTVVYYIMDGDDMLISTMADRAKAKAVQRDPRVSICVLNEQWPLGYLQVYGRAKLETDPEQGADMLRRVIDLMAGEPMPASKFPAIEEMARKEKKER